MPNNYSANLAVAHHSCRDVLTALSGVAVPADWQAVAAKQGQFTLKIGSVWLNSPVNPIAEAEKFAREIPHWAGGVVIVGTDCGYLLNAVHQALPASRQILVIAPEPAYLKLALETVNLSAALASGQVQVSLTKSPQEAKPILNEFCRVTPFVHHIVPAPLYQISHELYGRLGSAAEYAAHHSDEVRPRVFLVTGESGAGKTFFGQALSEQLNYPWRSADHIARMIMDTVRQEFPISNLAIWDQLARGLDVDKLQEHLWRDFARQVEHSGRGVSDGWVYQFRRFREPLRAAMRDIGIHPHYTLVNVAPPHDEYLRRQNEWMRQNPERAAGRVIMTAQDYELELSRFQKPDPDEMTDLVSVSTGDELSHFIAQAKRWEGTRPLSLSSEPPVQWDLPRLRNWIVGKNFYQRLKLGGTVVAGDVDTISKVDLLKLPPDFKGDSLLDIGCNTGAFCFAAKRRGAGRVVGIDVNGEFIMWARRIRDHVEQLPDVEFYPMEVMRIAELGQFDYILILAALHYMPDIKGVFKLLGDACRKTLVMDLVMAPNLLEQPVPALEHRRDYKDFVPNLAALKELVAPHFKRLDAIGRSVAPDKSLRIIFHAHK